MAHQLAPRPGRPYLSPREIVRRLREEFAYVEPDREAGADHLGDMIVRFLHAGAPLEIVEKHRRAQEQAVRIVIADEPTGDAYLDFVAMPDEGLFIGYESAEHEESARALLRRCAGALGYEIGLI
jgi:hypothetical protein